MIKNFCFDKSAYPIQDQVVGDEESLMKGPEVWPESAFGHVVAEGGSWAGVLIGPRLVIAPVGALFEGGGLRPAASFHTRCATVAVLRAWRVAHCALA
jgi:hypothetical protein